MSIYTPSHWSVFSFCGLLGFDSDLYLGGGDGWARRSNNGVDASNPKAATGSFSGSAAGARNHWDKFCLLRIALSGAPTREGRRGGFSEVFAGRPRGLIRDTSAFKKKSEKNNC